MRIMDYYLCPTNKVDDETRERICKKVYKISQTACRYVDNIYKVANVDSRKGETGEINRVWLYFRATKEQYTNNK